MGAQHFPTRAVHDSLCPTDASQPEEARDKSIQIPSFPSDVPVLTNSPHHRSSEGASGISIRPALLPVSYRMWRHYCLEPELSARRPETLAGIPR